jgi:hypothetical protein
MLRSLVQVFQRTPQALASRVALNDYLTPWLPHPLVSIHRTFVYDSGLLIMMDKEGLRSLGGYHKMEMVFSTFPVCDEREAYVSRSSSHGAYPIHFKQIMLVAHCWSALLRGRFGSRIATTRNTGILCLSGGSLSERYIAQTS